MRYVQKVVVRRKSRRERWKLRGSFLLKWLGASAVFIFIVYGATYVQDHLLLSDFLTVKVIECRGPEAFRSQIIRNVSTVRGRSLIKVSPKRITRSVKEKYPVISAFELKRSLPDRVEVTYSLREPVAVSHVGDRRVGVDKDGIYFALEHLSPDEVNSLPELKIDSSDNLGQALEFVRMWAESGFKVNASHQGLRTTKIAMDCGEIRMIFEQPDHESMLQVFWGKVEPQVFQEKLDRLTYVFSDLERNSLEPREINLRGVPQGKDSLIGKKQIIGRVPVKL